MGNNLLTDVCDEALSMMESCGGPAVLITPDYQIVAANSYYRKSYGDTPVQKNQYCYRVSHNYSVPCDQAGEVCPLKGVIETGSLSRVFHLHHTPHGDEHVEVEAYPINDADGNLKYFLEVIRSSKLASTAPSSSRMVGRSPSFNRVLELVQRVADSDATVLLLGESGTGKELVASAVHEGSNRSNGPFVPVDCSGLTETLFESELFGHEKGAFTGAQTKKIGLVEAAKGGTLFLDEIGDVPLSLQVKLLRLLETGTYRRVGGIEPQKADFRLVCATHRGLKNMVEDGSFRKDLYFRINAFPIDLPSLRDRQEDLPVLVESLLSRVARGRELVMSEEAIDCLRNYEFPGNIRELRNILERAALLTDGGEIQPKHLPEEVCVDKACDSTGTCCAVPVGITPTGLVTLEDAEASYLRWAVARFHGEKRALAEKLGVSERTLYRKLQELKPVENG